jgi:TolA-binding protein
MSHRPLVCIVLFVGALHAADKPNRDILELQREVAQLGTVLDNLQKSFDARFTALSAQIQTVGESAAALQKGLAQISQDQDRKIVPLVAEQGTRLEQANGVLTTMQQAVGDLTTAINRLQTQVVDLGNAVKVIQSPPAAPKPSAEELLKSAQTDRLGGKYDLAVQEYLEFLKNYSDSAEADVALFELGMTNYAMKNFAAALEDYGALAEKYPDSKRVPEALFYKSKSLASMGRSADARAACLDLRKRFPTNDFAKQCAVARP